MKLLRSSLRQLALAVSLFSICAADGKEISLIKGSFDATDSANTAKGLATAVFTPGRPKLRLDFWRLTAGATYQLTVDGVIEETFIASARGSAHLDFRLNAKGGQRSLDFDPRGKTLGINDGTQEVLSLVFSGEGEPDAIRVDERTRLTRAESELRGRVELRYLEQKNKDRFIIHFLGLERGTYELFVDGALQAAVDLTRGRSTMRSFEVRKNAHGKFHDFSKGNGHGHGKGNSKRLDLDFDPRGKVVDVVRDGEIIFTGEMLAQIPGLNGVNVGESAVTLTSTGVDTDASGSATLALTADEALSLQLEVAALPAGVYEVVIGGVVRGTVTVTGTEPASSGEVIFSTEPNAGELLLDFDPFGQSVEIRQGSTVFLTGTLGLALTELPPPTTTETELPLLNQGVQIEGSSHVRLVEDASALVGFEVELASVPAGNYELRVGGTLQGSIVVSEVNDVLRGELIFNHEGGTALPLTFDPRGSVVTIEQTGTILFQRQL